MIKIFSIGIGGFLGAVSRYLVTAGVDRLFKGNFPLGTLAVNLFGSFLLGFIYSLTLESELFTPNLRIALTTGFLGALTTFSTFTYETLSLLEGKELALGFSNVLFSIILGLLFAWFGITTGRLL